MATLANITTTPAVTTPAAPKKAAPKEAAPKAGKMPTGLVKLLDNYLTLKEDAKAKRGEASAATRLAALARAELLGACLNPPKEWNTTAAAAVDSFKSAAGKLTDMEYAVLKGARLV